MNKNKATASLMGMWIAIGTALGIIFHQLALGIAIGVLIGAASTGVARRKLNGNGNGPADPNA